DRVAEADRRRQGRVARQGDRRARSPRDRAPPRASGLPRAPGQGQAEVAPRRAAARATGNLMTIELVYETHSTTVDNEAGIATGWLEGRLSDRGREQAAELGDRRRDDGLAAVFTSDLGRAIETAEIAFAGSELPVHRDSRLRECNYGEMNGRRPPTSTRR